MNLTPAGHQRVQELLRGHEEAIPDDDRDI
jgi:hypothetical protein